MLNAASYPAGGGLLERVRFQSVQPPVPRRQRPFISFPVTPPGKRNSTSPLSSHPVWHQKPRRTPSAASRSDTVYPLFKSHEVGRCWTRGTASRRKNQSSDLRPISRRALLVSPWGQLLQPAAVPSLLALRSVRLLGLPTAKRTQLPDPRRRRMRSQPAAGWPTPSEPLFFARESPLFLTVELSAHPQRHVVQAVVVVV